jgi:hypothetical protein
VMLQTATFVDACRVCRGAAKGEGSQPRQHDPPTTCADAPPRQATVKQRSRLHLMLRGQLPHRGRVAQSMRSIVHEPP